MEANEASKGPKLPSVVGLRLDTLKRLLARRRQAPSTEESTSMSTGDGPLPPTETGVPEKATYVDEAPSTPGPHMGTTAWVPAKKFNRLDPSTHKYTQDGEVHRYGLEDPVARALDGGKMVGKTVRLLAEQQDVYLLTKGQILEHYVRCNEKERTLSGFPDRIKGDAMKELMDTPMEESDPASYGSINAKSTLVRVDPSVQSKALRMTCAPVVFGIGAISSKRAKFSDFASAVKFFRIIENAVKFGQTLPPLEDLRRGTSGLRVWWDAGSRQIRKTSNKVRDTELSRMTRQITRQSIYEDVVEYISYKGLYTADVVGAFWVSCIANGRIMAGSGSVQLNKIVGRVMAYRLRDFHPISKKMLGELVGIVQKKGGLPNQLVNGWAAQVNRKDGHALFLSTHAYHFGEPNDAGHDPRYYCRAVHLMGVDASTKRYVVFPVHVLESKIGGTEANMFLFVADREAKTIKSCDVNGQTYECEAGQVAEGLDYFDPQQTPEVPWTYEGHWPCELLGSRRAPVCGVYALFVATKIAEKGEVSASVTERELHRFIKRVYSDLYANCTE